MSDLPTSLRNMPTAHHGEMISLMVDAATEIERLNDRIAELEASLRAIKQCGLWVDSGCDPSSAIRKISEIAHMRAFPFSAGPEIADV